jgi:HlyD family secretion protein
MQKRTWLMVGVGVAALALNSCGQKPAPAETVPGEAASNGQVQSMNVVRVSMRDLSDRIEATGRLVIREEAAVGTELSGFRVQSVLVDEGDWVTQGQALARMDDTLLRAQIAQAEATQAQQKASADFKKSQLARSELLSREGAFSQAQLEQSRMESASADAAYLAAQASVNEMRTRQARMTLRAPVAGMILQRSLRPGDISSPATSAPYFRIARDGLVEVDAELPDARLASIHEGDPVEVTLSDGRVVRGTVRFISPRVEQATSLGRVRVSLPYDRANPLRPGGYARAVFNGTARNALAVHASAVRYEAGSTALMVVGDDNKVSRVEVKLGERVGDSVIITDGPPAGTRVLARGSAFTLEGDTIQPVEGPATAAAAAPAAPGAH